MQHTAIFQEQVALTPKDMRDTIESVDALLLAKLTQRLEGRCSRNGFVVPGTVKILSRSMGVLEKGRFTGSILFYLHAEGAVLNPPDGSLVEGEVVRKNKMGLYVSYQIKTGDGVVDAIKVIVPRDLPEHMGSEEYAAVEIGQVVSVEIKKSRFQVNDPSILSVGVFRGVVKGKRAGVGAAAPAAKPAPAPVALEEGLDEGEAAEREAAGSEFGELGAGPDAAAAEGEAEAEPEGTEGEAESDAEPPLEDEGFEATLKGNAAIAAAEGKEE